MFLCLKTLPFVYERLCKQLECDVCGYRIAGDSEHRFAPPPSKDDRFPGLNINPMEYYLSKLSYCPCSKVLGAGRRTCIDDNQICHIESVKDCLLNLIEFIRHYSKP